MEHVRTFLALACLFLASCSTVEPGSVVTRVGIHGGALCTEVGTLNAEGEMIWGIRVCPITPITPGKIPFAAEEVK